MKSFHFFNSSGDAANVVIALCDFVAHSCALAGSDAIAGSAIKAAYSVASFCTSASANFGTSTDVVVVVVVETLVSAGASLPSVLVSVVSVVVVVFRQMRGWEKF